MINAPGRHYREGISLIEFFDLFPTEETAEAWFVQQRWPNGIACPKCGSLSIVERKNRKPLPWRCKDCRKDFSVKTGSLMESSKLKLRVWLLAIYILTTNIKGTSSLKLHPGSESHPKDRVVLGPSDSRGMGPGAGSLQRSGGSRREFLRWQGEEQAQREENSALVGAPLVRRLWRVSVTVKPGRSG